MSGLRNPGSSGSGNGSPFSDNSLLILGDNGDIVLVLNSAGLAANAELTDVIVGTSVYATAIPANSMIISNITADGDIVFFAQTGGNSFEVGRFAVNTSPQFLLPEVDDQANPTLAFGAATGIYTPTTNEIAFAINGLGRFKITTSLFGSAANSFGAIIRTANVQTLPSLVPAWADLDTGVSRIATDVLAHIAGGHQMLVLTENTALANYVAALFDAPDQVNLSAATGSSWNLMKGKAVNVDFNDDGDDPITALNGLSLYLSAITVTSDDNLTATKASLLYVENPVDGAGMTFTNNYPINTESAAFLTSAGVWTDNPSTRLKKHDILDVTSAEMKLAISKLRARSWVYNDEWGDEGRSRYGVVAEEQPDFLYGLGTTQRNVTSPSIMAGFSLAGLKYHEDRIDELERRLAAVGG